MTQSVALQTAQLAVKTNNQRPVFVTRAKVTSPWLAMSASVTELMPTAFAHLAPMANSGINRRVFPAKTKLSTAQNALT